MSAEEQAESQVVARQAMGDWLDLASEHAEVACLLARKFPTHALYMTQQSMEAATKGLARGMGASHEDVRSWGHQNFNLFFWLMENLVRMGATPHIDEILASHGVAHPEKDVLTRLHDMVLRTANPRRLSKAPDREAASQFYGSMLTLPPEPVEFLSDAFTKLRKASRLTSAQRRLIQGITKKPFKLMLLAGNEDAIESLSKQVCKQLLERLELAQLRTLDSAIVESLGMQYMSKRFATIGEESIQAELENNSGMYKIPDVAKGYDTSIQVPVAFIGLFIVGGLVWPHESYPRYVAPPDAPDDIEQAAEQRKFGTQHYSEQLGVIKHIGTLTKQAREITKALRAGYQANYLFPIHEHVGDKTTNSDGPILA